MGFGSTVQNAFRKAESENEKNQLKIKVTGQGQRGQKNIKKDSQQYRENVFARVRLIEVKSAILARMTLTLVTQMIREVGQGQVCKVTDKNSHVKKSLEKCATVEGH